MRTTLSNNKLKPFQLQFNWSFSQNQFRFSSIFVHRYSYLAHTSRMDLTDLILTVGVRHVCLTKDGLTRGDVWWTSQLCRSCVLIVMIWMGNPFMFNTPYVNGEPVFKITFILTMMSQLVNIYIPIIGWVAYYLHKLYRDSVILNIWFRRMLLFRRFFLLTNILYLW